MLPVQGSPTDLLGQLGPNVIGPGYLQGGYSAPSDPGYYYDTSGSSGGSSGGGGGSTPAVNLAQYDPAIQNQQAAYGRFDTDLAAQNANIQNAYNQTINQLNQQKALGNQQYTTTKTQTAQDYVTSKNTIGSNAGQSLTGLQRLLGSRGAGGGSAATISAPQAVTRQATLQRNDVGNTFGKNNQALDTNWNNYLNTFNQNTSAADIKRQNDERAAKASIDQNRASVLQSLAGLFGQRASLQGGNPTAASQPYLDQANSFLNEASQLGYQVPIPQVAPLVYNAPSLGSYTVNPNAAPQYQGQTPGNDYFSPYLQALLGKDKQTQGITA